MTICRQGFCAYNLNNELCTFQYPEDMGCQRRAVDERAYVRI